MSAMRAESLSLFERTLRELYGTRTPSSSLRRADAARATPKAVVDSARASMLCSGAMSLRPFASWYWYTTQPCR